MTGVQTCALPISLVKGRFFKVLGRIVVFILAIMIVQIILSEIPYAGYLVSSFLAPVFIIPFYLILVSVIS